MSARRGRVNAPKNGRRKPAEKTSITPMRLVEWAQPVVVLLLAAIGLATCLLSAYSLAIPAGRVVGATLLVVAIVTAVWKSRYRGWLFLLCLLAAAVWTMVNFDKLLQGALLLILQVIDPLNLRLPDLMQTLLQEHDAAESLALARMALTALLCFSTMLAGYFVLCRSSLVGLLIATLPPLLPAPFYSLAPGVAPFFCLLASYLVLFIGNIGKYMPIAMPLAGGEPTLACRETELSAQRSVQQLVSLLALPVIALAALLACRILPEESYVRPAGIESLQEKILSWDIGEGTLFRSNDGLTHGNLRNLTDIRFSGKTVLNVRVSEKRALYLRGFAGAGYSDDGWESVSNAAYARYAKDFSDIAPQNLHAAAAAATSAQSGAYTLSVRNVGAARTSLWIPGGLVTTDAEIHGAAYEQDTSLTAAGVQGVSDYTVTALPCNMALSRIATAGTDSLHSAYSASAGSAMGLSAASGADAARVRSTADQYINYVFSTYTALPTETQRAAEALLTQYGLARNDGDGTLDLYAVCRSLYDVLTTQCSYAYSPGEIPAGVDFATYFLNESRSGYCVHFATTATVLLRAMGIPARYAEGYIVVSGDYDKLADAQGYIPIEDTHAHAWAEVFDPAQLEWIPVEMTASAGNPGAEAPGNSDEESGTTPQPTPSATPSPAPSPTPSASPDAIGEPDPLSSAEPSETPEIDGAMSLPEETPSPEPTAENDPGAESTPETNDGTPPEDNAADAPEQDGGNDQEDDGQGNDGETPPDSPGDGDTPNGPDGPDGNSAGSLPPVQIPKWLWIPLLALLLLTLAIYLLRRAMLQRRLRAFYQKDVNAGVLAACRYTVDLLRFAGCEPIRPLETPEAYALAVEKRQPYIDGARLQAAMELAQRASFSGKPCTKRERDEAIAFAESVSRALRARLSRGKRILLFCRYPEKRRKRRGKPA